MHWFRAIKEFFKNIFGGGSSNQPPEPQTPAPTPNPDDRPDGTDETNHWVPEHLRREYRKLYYSMELTLRVGSNGVQKASTLTWTTNRIEQFKQKYVSGSQLLYKELGITVPWKLIGALHMREASGDFSKNMLNGQPLDQVTTWVPSGYGPYDTWEESLVDSFRLKDEQIGPLPKVWDIATMLYFSERYNGWGYRYDDKKDIVGYSPYVFAYSQHYITGYYYSDGKFKDHLIAKGVGVAMIIKNLKD